MDRVMSLVKCAKEIFRTKSEDNENKVIKVIINGNNVVINQSVKCKKCEKVGNNRIFS